MAEVFFGVTGLVGTIDVCIKWGRALAQACDDYRQAEANLEEILVRIQNCWLRALAKLEVAKKLEGTMSNEQRDVQQRVFTILGTKLENVTRILSKCVQRPALNLATRLQLLRRKDALEGAVDDLESWERQYQPSWFAFLKHADPSVDTALEKIVQSAPAVTAESSSVSVQFRRALKESSDASRIIFIREEAFQGFTREVIMYSKAQVATRAQDDRQFIVDTVTGGAVTQKDARDFARRLRHSDPLTFGLLECKGVVRYPETMDFLFRIPDRNTDIHSLRHLLLSGQAHDSLSDRLDMAQKLARAVHSVHLYGFVHKSICPETILGFSKPESRALPSMVSLVGFQVIRNADGNTHRVTDIRWETNLYRHPRRQGQNVQYYIMQHDIYSLGVCLLEIGLWESLVAYDSNQVAHPSMALGLDGNGQLRSPDALKDHLVSLSRSTVLRTRMGTKYSEVVETCLTCLDEGNLNFGDESEFQDEDGVVVGERYIEKVLGILNDISL